MKNTEAIPSKKHLPFGGAKAIFDQKVLSFMNEISFSNVLENILYDDFTKIFLKNYIDWLKSSKINNLQGLTDFSFFTYSNGTTETFDKWYLMNKHKRLRVFKGEYMYHYAIHRNLNINFTWLDDEPLDKNDYVIISLPFADSGCIHPETIYTLDLAKKLGVPVLIDMAYMGTCYDINFNLSHEAIHTVVFSLSKTFPVAHMRIGMRMSKFDYDDGLDIYRKTSYDNRIGAYIGNLLINFFSIDYIPQKYKLQQEKKCIELNCNLSNSVMFGLGKEEFKEYNRGGNNNRLYFGESYEKS